MEKYLEISIDKLKPYKNNARTHSTEQVQQIADSINEFGFINPILIDGDYNIIAGHGRLMAAKILNMEKVPCLFIDNLSEAQKKAYILADNRLAELAGWDYELLQIELSELSAMDFDISLTGFDTIDFGNEDDHEIQDDEFEADILNDPISKRGDLYQLGNHRLLCGDATSIKCLEKLMGGAKADITFHSPPYNVKNASLRNGKERYISKETDYKTNDEYLDLLIDSTNRSLEKSRYAFVNLQFLAANKVELIRYLYNFKDKFVDIMFWAKNTVAPAMQQQVLNSQVEVIFIFSYESNTRMIKTADFRGTISNLIKTENNSNNKYADVHGAGFPISFAALFVENMCKKNDSVIDLFGGTGTTMIACEQLKRSCYMMEIEPVYCDLIIKRWEDFTGEKAVKIDG